MLLKRNQIRLKNLPEHADISPSGMKRILKCVRSLSKKGAIYQESSEAAQLGTDAHYAGEIGILQNKLAEDTLTVKKHGQDTIDAVNIYISYIKSIISKCDRYFVEGKFVYSSNFFGTSDFTGVVGDTLYVVDYKNGMSPVDAENNEQGMTYAGLVLYDGTMFPDDAIDNITKVKIVIVQPRTSGEPISEWECSIHDIIEHMNKAIKVSQLTEDEIDHQEHYHGEHCFFCPRKINCERLNDLTGNIKFAKEDALSNEDLGHLLEEALIIESRIKSIRELAYSKAQNGSKISGWKLVNKRAVRKWKNEDQIIPLLTGMGYTKDDVYNHTMKSPAQMENLVGKDNKEDLMPYIQSVSSGTTLVKSTDKREEVVSKENVQHAIDKIKAFNLKR